MALPVFGQRMIYRKEKGSNTVQFFKLGVPDFLVTKTIPEKKQKIFLFDPPIAHSVNNNDIIDWIWEKRIPFFFRSAIYAEYKVN